mmetsp:Transcript_1909/g.6098  ORF Transcript_1909/g.6098 Transcript_1909/m.6098 type:complete len:205 (-) Transcript_1909:238-852(-)
MMAPYLENSALSSASLMWSGREPTKIFRAPSMPGAPPVPGTVGSMESLPNMPWCLAMVTSQGRSEPGKVRTLSQLFLAICACSEVPNVRNAHWRFDSHVVFMKRSTTCPYLENSARRAASVMESGSEPTKILRGASCASVNPWSLYPPAIWPPIAMPPGWPLRGSCPNIPWFRASVTSQGLKLPANCRMPLHNWAAMAAWSGLT